MSRDALLARAQSAALAGMVDACTIRRRNGGTTNPITGYPATEPFTDVYAGPCRVQQHQASADEKEAGEDRVLLLRLEVQLPVATSAGLEADDLITITASRDPDLVGRVFEIHDLAHKTDASARRVQCNERST